MSYRLSSLQLLSESSLIVVASSDLSPIGPRNKYDITSRKFKKRIVVTTGNATGVGIPFLRYELPLALASGQGHNDSEALAQKRFG